MIRHDRRNALARLASVATSLAACAALPSANAAAKPAPLKDLAAAKGLRFGNAVGYQYFKDPAYRALTARECNVIVAENEMKWPFVEPKPGQYAYSQPDEMIAWARKEGMQVRGHTLVWQPEKWLPEWVAKYDFGQGPAKAEKLLRDHVTRVCQHFGKNVYSWDVVNEAIEPETGEYRVNEFTKRLGAVDQIELAFRVAHEQAPHAQLVYNDFMGEEADNAKHRAGVLKLLQELKKRGAPVQALGLQSHIGSSNNGRQKADMREWRKFLDEVTGMGLDLLITEFDVNDKSMPADIRQRDAGVAAVAKDYLDVTLSYPQTRDLLVWGIADHASWLQTWEDAARKDKLAQRPLPYDASFKAKPLREAIAASLKAMPKRS